MMTLVQLTPETLHELATLAQAASGSIELEALAFSHEALTTLSEFIQQQGHVLRSLSASLLFSQKPYHHDWYALDFVTTCPHLEALALERIDVNASVWQHPRLKLVNFEAVYLQTAKQVTLADALETVRLYAVNWANAQTLILRQHPRLRSFDYSLDEDEAERCPSQILVEDCPELTELYLNVSGGWTVELVGTLPKLANFGASSGRYGEHEIRLAQVADASHPKLLTLRDGQGQLSGRVFAFTGEFKHFNVNKAQQAVRLLGGEIAADLDDETITDIVVSRAAFAEFDEDRYPDTDVMTETDFKDEIYGWY